MTNQDKIRRTLLARMKHLRERDRHIEREFRGGLDSDLDEQALQREEQEILEAVEHSALNDIAAIEKALVRLDSGTYGFCATCGNPIAPKRLEAEPMATQCITCAA